MSIDPTQFIISKKRKKYKFAVFSNLRNCFEFENWTPPERPYVLELGAGSAYFSVELATRQPESFYVAMDVKADRLQQGARRAEERGLHNIQFVRAQAELNLASLPDASLDSLWLTFSDPFPKKRQAKHRLTHPIFLEQYRRLLIPDGMLHMKTDNHRLFDWSLEQLVSARWSLIDLVYDLHSAHSANDNSTIITTFEQRFLDEGLPICYVSANRHQ